MKQKEKPQSIIDFTIKLLNDIIIEKLKLKSGLASENITLLNTNLSVDNGELLQTVLQYILQSDNKGNTSYISKLPEIYSFEENNELRNIVNSKITTLFSEQNLDYSINSLPINVLDEPDNQIINDKSKKEPLVVFGYPPFVFDNHRKHKTIDSLMLDYYGQHRTKALTDTSIKYIRYAQYKLENREQGVIAFLCNNAFLSGLTFSQMRKTLYEDFDQIFIIDLQESSRIRIEEKTEELFDNVAIGMSLVFFVKVNYKLPKEIRYFSLSDISDKKTYLETHHLQNIDWQIVPLTSRFSFVDNRLIKETSREIYSNKKQILPVAIKQIEIENFKGINQLSIHLPIDNQWVFFTGENASGKTSILQAIALGLYDKEGRKLQELTKGSLSKRQAQIAVEIYQKGQSIINDTANPDIFLVMNEIAAYNPIRVNLKDSSEITSILDTFFAESPKMFNIERKLLEISEKEFKFIEDVLKELIPTLEGIRKNTDKPYNPKIVYKEKKNEKTISFAELAMGMRSIIGFIGDMLIKLSPGKNIVTTKEIKGIVIIDEFDNHLHPKWQRDLVEKLTELFPKVQFIVSTHSPIPFLGAPKNSVFIKVDRDKEKGITAEKLDVDVSKLTPNTILTSPVFGFENINSDEVDIDEVETADRYSNVEAEKRMKEKLKILKQSDEDFFNSLKVE